MRQVELIDFHLLTLPWYPPPPRVIASVGNNCDTNGVPCTAAEFALVSGISSADITLIPPHRCKRALCCQTWFSIITGDIEPFQNSLTRFFLFSSSSSSCRSPIFRQPLVAHNAHQWPIEILPICKLSDSFPPGWKRWAVPNPRS
jgi:hypothetical protein